MTSLEIIMLLFLVISGSELINAKEQNGVTSEYNRKQCTCTDPKGASFVFGAPNGKLCWKRCNDKVTTDCLNAM